MGKRYIKEKNYISKFLRWEELLECKERVDQMVSTDLINTIELLNQNIEL